MFCHNCGAKLNPGSKFCGSCGQKMEVESAHTPSAVPPPPKSTDGGGVPPPPPASMMQGKGAHSQVNNTNPGTQPWPGYSTEGQGPSMGGPPGQQFNPQFNQKQKSNKGCLISILIVVLLVIVLAVLGLAYVYFAADLAKGGLPSPDILGNIGISSSSPEKIAEDLFAAIGTEDVEGFISLITADSIEFIKAEMIDPNITFEEEVEEGLYWINTYGTEDYGADWHKSITYQLAEKDGDKAKVLATLAGDTIDIYLIQEDGKWKVDWSTVYGW